MIFVGQLVTVDESYKDKRISQAGNNYQLKFIELVKPTLAISLTPIFYDNNLISKSNNLPFLRIYSSLPLPKFLNKVYKLVYDSWTALKLIKSSRDNNVFFYNLDKQNLGIIFFSKYFLKKNVFVIIADLPSFNNITIFHKISNFFLKRINGVLVFNSNIRINKNQKVLPGLLKEDVILFKEINLLNRNVILSGSLGKTTGLELALEAFGKLPNYNLFITGKPYKYEKNEFESIIERYTALYNNIHYMGLLNYDDYIITLQKCDIALSLRNPNDDEHYYNFPSKILEYLSLSKIVISTIEYQDIPSEFLYYSEFNSDSLVETLNRIDKYDVSIFNNNKRQIFDYLRLNFTSSNLILMCNKLINEDYSTEKN